MALTQQQLALQMLAQLRRLDPSVSAEVGTPERKLLDTVAQSLADSQIDLGALQQGLDIDSKYGDGLDRFLALFGFARQKATYATGFVTFSRNSPATADIVIPINSQVRVPPSDANDPHEQAVFYTTVAVTLLAGQTEVVAPIRASVAGAASNVAANTITEVIGAPILGITGITNEVATKGGIDREGDPELKVRFKNTVFRNLAGTRDQYIALAVSTQYSLKANVLGPQSFWREYMQVPPVDDSASYDSNGDSVPDAGNGTVNEFTTAMATLPYAKGIWTNLPTFVSNGEQGALTWFYRPDVDFRVNTSSASRNRGDTYRFAGNGLDVAASAAPFRPNITFTNVYTGANEDLQVVRPGDLVLVEFAYMSTSSRNDLDRNITNAVDVFVDGGNNQFALTVLNAPTNATLFIDDPTSKYHFENYRRIGEPEHRPIKGNYHMPLMWQPVTDLPAQIIVGDNTYLKNTHYWLVEDISELGGTTRARNGIEWSQTVKGNSSGTARLITEWIAGNFQPIEVEDYSFDRNIVDLQTALESSKQVTTDVLAHKARTRYFKFDITVMYTSGASRTEVNQAIHDAVDVYLKGQYFGAIVQLSDILQVIHSVDGVDNVRWSSDVPSGADLARCWECDVNGRPTVTAIAEHLIVGTASTPARQAIRVYGSPTNSLDYVGYRWGGVDSGTAPTLVAAVANPALVKSALESIAGLGTVTVTLDTSSANTAYDFTRDFIVQWSANGAKALIEPIPHLKSGPKIIFNDFVLRDSELPALPTSTFTGDYYGYNDIKMPVDTVPGFIIRTRAQNTWLRS